MSQWLRASVCVSGVKRCQTLALVALVVVIYRVHEGKACWLVKLTNVGQLRSFYIFVAGHTLTLTLPRTPSPPVLFQHISTIYIYIHSNSFNSLQHFFRSFKLSQIISLRLAALRHCCPQDSDSDSDVMGSDSDSTSSSSSD